MGRLPRSLWSEQTTQRGEEKATKGGTKGWEKVVPSGWLQCGKQGSSMQGKVHFVSHLAVRGKLVPKQLERERTLGE